MKKIRAPFPKLALHVPHNTFSFSSSFLTLSIYDSISYSLCSIIKQIRKEGMKRCGIQPPACSATPENFIDGERIHAQLFLLHTFYKRISNKRLFFQSLTNAMNIMLSIFLPSHMARFSYFFKGVSISFVKYKFLMIFYHILPFATYSLQLYPLSPIESR